MARKFVRRAAVLIVGRRFLRFLDRPAATVIRWAYAMRLLAWQVLCRLWGERAGCAFRNRYVAIATIGFQSLVI